MNHKIIPLFIGCYKEDIDMSNLVYRHPIGDTYTMPNGFFAIQCEDGEYVMVDAGMSEPEKVAEMGFAALDESCKSFEELMALHQIDPLQVKTVIVTHLHWDHVYNLDRMPNAKIYVQKKELAHAVAPYPPERGSFGYVPGRLDPPWLKAADRIIPVDGDAEILPGISVTQTAGHTYGGQSVLVETKEGIYAIIGDFYFLPESWEKGVPLARFVSAKDWYDGYRKLKGMKLAGILPTHDIHTYEREVWGDGNP